MNRATSAPFALFAGPFLALALLAGAPSLALAQGAKPNAPAQAPAAPIPPPSPAPRSLADSLSDEAKADYESGRVLFGDGDHQNALLKFKSAHEKSGDPRLLWNMAACEKNLRHYAKALALVRRYMAEGGDKLTEQDMIEGRELVNVMEPLTAKLRITVNEPGAEVFVDDERVGTSPLEPLVVDIGTRKVVVRKPDFEEYVRDVPVGGAAEIPLEVGIAKIVREGRVTVRASEGATIAIDGKVVGVGIWTGVLPSGGHSLRVTADKMRPYQSEFLLQSKESREIEVTLDPEPSRGVPAWAWVVGGVVVAGGLGTAGYFLFRGEDKYEGPPGNLDPGIVQASRPSLRFR